MAQLTRFGWVLLGLVGIARPGPSITSQQCSIEDLSAAVRRFWESEEPPHVAVPMSAEEQECERHFTRTCQRLEDGRYQVRLPLRSALPDLSSTRRAALRLMEVIERRFTRDLNFRDKYRAFMGDYLARGHMSPVSPEPRTSRVCFLPLHGVLKGAGVEAKIRVVFNGSSRTTSGASLNAALHVGPNLLPVLGDVLSRWRCHRHVFMADVQQMYRQIRVHPEDRRLQRIVWKEGSALDEFELNTVTYGLASAPYLAIRVLRQLASDEEGRFPRGAEALRHATYMNDILTGAATLEDACDLRRQVSDLTMAGGFPLKKWAANHPALLVDIPSTDRLQQTEDVLLPTEDHSVLGLRWNPVADHFHFTVRTTAVAVPTKRTVLSQTARLFDPLGWLSPVVIRAKLLIQTTWLQQLDWDAPLPRAEKAL